MRGNGAHEVGLRSRYPSRPVPGAPRRLASLARLRTGRIDTHSYPLQVSGTMPLPPKSPQQERADGASVRTEPTFPRSRRRLLARRPTFLRSRRRLLARRPTFLRSRRRLLARRPTFLRSHRRLLARRPTFLRSHRHLLARRTTFLRSHRRLLARRPTFLRSHRRLLARRAPFLGPSVSRPRPPRTHVPRASTPAGGFSGGAASLPPGKSGHRCGGCGAERAKRVEAERPHRTTRVSGT